jgi:DNA (cytosine-5)-methyltransferase 1
MAVSYNRLWKLLIDKGMTKTEMRKAAGISTNVLAKMGKNETVSMETLARIAAVMECGLDDIVELTNDRKDVCNEI